MIRDPSDGSEKDDRVIDTRDLEIRNLYEALKAAEYYIDRLERVQMRKRVTDMCEAMEHYHHAAAPIIKAYDKEFSS